MSGEPVCERVFRNTGSPILRLSDVVPGDARELFQHALDHGWEGLIAKEAHSVYHTGKRTRDWRKIKIVQEQEFVVGGWTDSRTGRSSLRRAAAGLLRRRRTEVRRPHGQRVQPARARARHSTAEAAGSCGAAVHDAAPDQRAAALDETLSGSAAEVHRMDRRWAASPSYLSRHEGRCETGDGAAGADETENESSES